MTLNSIQNPSFMRIQQTLDDSKIRKNRVSQTIKQITSQQRYSDTIQSIQTYLRPGALQDFFINHSHLWTELCNVLRSGTVFRQGDIPEFQETEYGYEVYSLFLTRNRKADIGTDLMRMVRTEIFHNTALLKHAQTRPSILDSGSHIFNYIQKENLQSTIESFIVRWLLDTVEWCSYEEINTHLPHILEKMCQYLPQVFGQDTYSYHEIARQKTLDELVSTIVSGIKTTSYFKYGARRQDLMRIIQSFHAWGNIDAIEAAYSNAQTYADPENMKMLLKKVGIHLDNIIPQHGSEIMYHGMVSIDTATYPFYWRSKSMKSILQKLWQTAEYSNQDALRDMLGMTILIPDDANTNVIAKVLSAFQKLMPQYGYIAKNRNMLSKEDFERIIYEGRGRRKLPVYTISSSASPRASNNTTPHLKNIAISGFLQGNENPACGSEVQILTQPGFIWKKQEDPYYKVRGMIELLTRWELFVTPARLKSSLEFLIGYHNLSLINNALEVTEWPHFSPLKDIDDLLYFLLKKGDSLHAYQNDTGDILFVYPPHTSNFLEIMRNHTWNRIMPTQP